MSYLENSFKQTVKVIFLMKKWFLMNSDFSYEEVYLAEVLKYKKKHSVYVG